MATTDPASSIRYEVKIDGVDTGTWTGCDGLSAEFEILEVFEGGLNDYVHRLPGRLKYTNVKLTRAIDSSSSGVATWFAKLRADVQRRTASIAAFDGNKKEIARWNLIDVVPVKWTGPTLTSTEEKVASETLELAHNGFLD